MVSMEALFPLVFFLAAAVCAIAGIAVLSLKSRAPGNPDPTMQNENAGDFKDGMILTEESRSRALTLCFIAYLVGAVLTVVSAAGGILTCGLLLLFGLAIRVIGILKISPVRKSGAVVILAAVSVPVVTPGLAGFAGAAAWVFPAVWLVAAILMCSRKAILLVFLSFVLTQVILWLRSAGGLSGLQNAAIQIVLFSMLTVAALYVNRAIMSRLKAYDKQTSGLRLMSRLSSDFVSVSEVNMNDLIARALELTGRYCGASSALFAAFPEENRPFSSVCEWCADGVPTAADHIRRFSPRTIDWLRSCVTTGGILKTPAPEELPTEAAELKELLIKQNVNSGLCVPVTSKGRLLGYCCFLSTDAGHIWAADAGELLKVTGDLLGNALAKVIAETEVRRMAFYDTLTGLPNRALFRNRLDYEMKKANRTEKLIGVVFLDLDNFKYVNDTIGHKGGDELLRQVAGRLSGSIRETDTLSRFGGDEFLLMLTNVTQEEDIRTIVGKILSAVRKPVLINGQEYFVSASAGVAVYPTDGYDTETLIKNADLAMYSSKSLGKNSYSFVSPEMKYEALEKMKLRNSLYRAQERNEFVIEYQPQLDIRTRRIIGLEALIRWEHPTFGQIMPEKFLPVAEQAGLINPIGEWLLEVACRQTVAWGSLGTPLRIAVNLSVEQLRDPHIVDTVGRILNITGLRPDCLELEIMESMAFKQSSGLMTTLAGLKSLGVLIAIDDFGTDYSSFLQLKLLSVDRIKMDMQFTQGISVSRKDEAIVKGIIQLAKNLDIKVIAEGVETKEQYDFLDLNGCDEAQGYYFYRPMSESDVEAVLRNGAEAGTNL